LRNEVYQRLGDFQSEVENPPAKAGESEIADLERRLEQCGRRLDELWEVIEAGRASAPTWWDVTTAM
jgi:hypothetical protein